MPHPNRALIIAEPWIDLILEGRKTWEMRPSSTGFRGWIALSRKGSAMISGVARLTDCLSPLTRHRMLDTTALHGVPADAIRSGLASSWRTPWVLADVTPLRQAVPFRPGLGAVVWASLGPEEIDAVAAQLPQGELLAV